MKEAIPEEVSPHQIQAELGNAFPFSQHSEVVSYESMYQTVFWGLLTYLSLLFGSKCHRGRNSTQQYL
jgi:hypothetical protein